MARPKSVHPTARHRRILETIRKFCERGVPPAVGELVNALGLAGPSSLDRTLKIMERNGFIEIHGGGLNGKRRIVTLSVRTRASIGQGALPILGRIPAGVLAEALQDCETAVELDRLLSWKAGDFLLVVKGDSMTGDGILPGDKVLLRPGLNPRDGEIAAVQVGQEYEASLKHVHFNDARNTVQLRASNPAYRDVFVPLNQVRVAGVYRGLVRSKP